MLGGAVTAPEHAGRACMPVLKALQLADRKLVRSTQGYAHHMLCPGQQQPTALLTTQLVTSDVNTIMQKVRK
jgi:hypothetical protein